MNILIGKADEFEVIFNDVDKLVTVYDGEDSVRLLMPISIWLELTTPLYKEQEY